jgi:hypothetical protein
MIWWLFAILSFIGVVIGTLKHCPLFKEYFRVVQDAETVPEDLFKDLDKIQ